MISRMTIPAITPLNPMIVMTRVTIALSPPYQCPPGQEPEQDSDAFERMRGNQRINQFGQRRIPPLGIVPEGGRLPFKEAGHADDPVGESGDVQPGRRLDAA